MKKLILLLAIFCLGRAADAAGKPMVIEPTLEAVRQLVSDKSIPQR